MKSRSWAVVGCTAITTFIASGCGQQQSDAEFVDSLVKNTTNEVAEKLAVQSGKLESYKKRLVGTWNYSAASKKTEYAFKDDGTYTITTTGKFNRLTEQVTTQVISKTYALKPVGQDVIMSVKTVDVKAPHSIDSRARTAIMSPDDYKVTWKGDNTLILTEDGSTTQYVLSRKK